MFFLYSTEPRRSAIGSAASAAAAAASAIAPASGTRPESAASAPDARIGAIPRFVSPTRARDGAILGDRELDGRAGHGVVAHLSLELHVGATAAGGRRGDPELGEDLAG